MNKFSKINVFWGPHFEPFNDFLGKVLHVPSRKLSRECFSILPIFFRAHGTEDIIRLQIEEENHDKKISEKY